MAASFHAHGVKRIVKISVGFAGIKPATETPFEAGDGGAGRRFVGRAAALGRRCA